MEFNRLKKISLLTFAIAFSLGVFAQCNSTEEVNNMPTTCRKEYSENYLPAKEQENWMTEIYTSVIEPSINNTKGLRGKWKPMGNYKATPEGLIKSGIDMYMNLMGCRDHKIYNKDEAGLILVFELNGFSGGINACTNVGDTIIKNRREKLYINDMLHGRQIYHLQKQTPSDKYANLAFYTITDNAKYFVIAKPGVPLFIPVTVRQALEISRNKQAKRIEVDKQELLLPSLKPETRADYEKRMAKDFASYRSTFPDPEKFISELIQQLEDQKKGFIKSQQEMIEFQSKCVDVLSDYLKTASPEELDKPAYNGSFLSITFKDKSDFTSILNTPEAGELVILNPDYFNKTISKAAPQFISVELRIQDGSPVTLKALNSFEANLDFDKLQHLLVK